MPKSKDDKPMSLKDGVEAHLTALQFVNDESLKQAAEEYVRRVREVIAATPSKVLTEANKDQAEVAACIMALGRISSVFFQGGGPKGMASMIQAYAETLAHIAISNGGSKKDLLGIIDLIITPIFDFEGEMNEMNDRIAKATATAQ